MLTAQLLHGLLQLVQGPAQGALWDPHNLRPLVNTPAGQAAMDVISRLFPYTFIHSGGHVNETDLVCARA